MNSRKEMLDALLEGKRLVHNSARVELFYDAEHTEGPFVVEFSDGTNSRLNNYWGFYGEFAIKKEPKKRPMTRDEILNFVAEHSNCLVKTYRGWVLAHQFAFDADNAGYTYCLVADGKRTEPRKFEVEE